MYTLPADFWAHFAAHHWEKSPLLIKQPFGPLVTSAHLFDGLVKASEQYRAGYRDIPFRFCIESAEQLAEVGRYLPELADGSVAGYAARITEKLGGRCFGLLVNEYQSCDAQVYLNLREFLRGLYQRVGVPVYLSEAVVFLGDYDKTPFGVHQDPGATFSFVIAGRKTVRAWPDEAFRDRPEISHNLHYEKFLDSAITLEGEAGDLMYWPSSYWHVAECRGGLSMTLNLAMYMKRYPERHVFRHVMRMLEQRLPASNGVDLFSPHPAHPQARVGKLPKLMKTADAALEGLKRDPQLKQTMRVEWMNRVTGFGFFEVPPPLADAALDNDAVVVGNPHYPIVWLPGEDAEVVCSANGHAFSVAAHPHIVKLLNRLNQPRPSRVADLIKKYAGTVKVDSVEFEACPEDVRAVLTKLYSLRAITTVDGG